jgi:hypothetical protein
VNADAVAAGEPNPNYQAYLEEGNDIGGIDVGLLVKTPRISVVDVTQFGKATTYVEPGGVSALLNDRPPLVLRAIVNSDAHPPYPVTVIVNHLRSLSGVDDPADGDPTERIVSIGDYNAFQFNDGYVDSIGTIKGSPTPANEVVLASGDLVDPNLVDLVDFVPAGERYSFSFDGNAQELDHVLITTGPQNRLRPVDLQYGRMDSDFPEIYRSDPNRPERLSDHDPLMAYFSLDLPPVCATASAAASTFPPNHTMRPVAITNVTDPEQDAVTLTVTAICQDEPPNAQPSIFAVDGTGVGTASAAVRAEVNHPGDGRVYHIFFDADDGKGGVCSGEVKVNVPVSPKGTAIDGGPLFDSTSPNGAACVMPGSRR